MVCNFRIPFSRSCSTRCISCKTARPGARSFVAQPASCSRCRPTDRLALLCCL